MAATQEEIRKELEKKKRESLGTPGRGGVIEGFRDQILAPIGSALGTVFQGRGAGFDKDLRTPNNNPRAQGNSGGDQGAANISGGSTKLGSVNSSPDSAIGKRSSDGGNVQVIDNTDQSGITKSISGNTATFRDQSGIGTITFSPGQRRFNPELGELSGGFTGQDVEANVRRNPDRLGGTFSTVGSISGIDPINNPDGEVAGQPFRDFVNQRYAEQVANARVVNQRVSDDIGRREALKSTQDVSRSLGRLISDISLGRTDRNLERQLGGLAELVNQNSQSEANRVEARIANRNNLEAQAGSQAFDRQLALERLSQAQDKNLSDELFKRANLKTDRARLGDTQTRTALQSQETLRKAQGAITDILGSPEFTDEVKAQRLLDIGLPEDIVQRYFPNLPRFQQ